MTTEFDTSTFATAYLVGNLLAQTQDPTSPSFKGAYQLADELGYDRKSMGWEASVGGAASWFILKHQFGGKGERWTLKFPSFYAECAFMDGKRDASAGHDNSRPSFMRHGEVEPIGMAWYEAGRKA